MKINLCGAIAAGFALVLVAGCSKPASHGEGDAAVFADKAMGRLAEAKSPEPAEKPHDPLAVPQLAYDYAYSFTAPAAGIDSLRAADQAACEAAGPAECQMISMDADNNADAGAENRTLELRVSPAWLKRWQGQVASSVKAVHGRISHQGVTSEDLSLQIVDTTAHIQNKIALRDRLQQIIRTSNGKIADLVAAETQLSDTQAEIDSAQSALAVMQKRVATTHLTLNYLNEGSAAGESSFGPVSQALHGALHNMMLMVGILITVIAFLVPVAVLAAPIVWWWRKRRKPAKAASGTGD